MRPVLKKAVLEKIASPYQQLVTEGLPAIPYQKTDDPYQRANARWKLWHDSRVKPPVSMRDADSYGNNLRDGYSAMGHGAMEVGGGLAGSFARAFSKKSGLGDYVNRKLDSWEDQVGPALTGMGENITGALNTNLGGLSQNIARTVDTNVGELRQDLASTIQKELANARQELPQTAAAASSAATTAALNSDAVINQVTNIGEALQKQITEVGTKLPETATAVAGAAASGGMNTLFDRAGAALTQAGDAWEQQGWAPMMQYMTSKFPQANQLWDVLGKHPYAAPLIIAALLGAMGIGGSKLIGGLMSGGQQAAPRRRTNTLYDF